MRARSRCGLANVKVWPVGSLPMARTYGWGVLPSMVTVEEVTMLAAADPSAAVWSTETVMPTEGTAGLIGTAPMVQGALAVPPMVQDIVTVGAPGSVLPATINDSIPAGSGRFQRWVCPAPPVSEVHALVTA